MQRLLTAAAVALCLCAGVVGLIGGLQISLGPVRISATSPWRLVFEAAVLLLVAECLGGLSRPRAALVLILLFLGAAAADAPPTRVGDGFEYLGMARNLAHGLPPALSPDDFRALRQETLAHGDRTWDTQPMPSLRASDGRFDFPHFWLCSLVAAPMVALASRMGMHPVEGFTMMNLALMLGLGWLLLQRRASLVAVLVAAMLLWWVDKAHADVFVATLTAAALLLQRTVPWASVVLLGVVSAQMPALGALLAAAIIECNVRYWPDVRLLAASGAAIAIAAAYPVYYLWHQGVMSPLSQAIIPHVPAVRALITPVVDLNLGVFWFDTGLCALVVAGAVLAMRRRNWVGLPTLMAGAIGLLVAAAQTPNVNHGGTPGPSRYGVWLMAMMLPLAVEANVALRSRRLVALVASLTVVFAALKQHPRLADSAITPTPTMLAAWVWTNAPALDNPLPEVFVERLSHVDGQPAVPISTTNCEKALTIGEGTHVRWPSSCPSMPTPKECAAAGVLCYANRGVMTLAPAQAGFSPGM